MEYHIVIDEITVASFEHEADRDICIDALRDYWKDADFSAVDDGD